MNRQILRLAIPNVITNITVPLLGMVDTAIVGHLPGDRFHSATDYLGAIAIGSMIFNAIYWLFGFLRMGTSGFAAQAFGARNPSETINILLRGSVLSLGIALLLILLQYPIGNMAMQWTGSSESVKTLALQYFYIRIWAAPATLGMYVMKGWFIGMQNSRLPMIIAIIINLLNILFSLFFVHGLGMQMAGVAWGTVLAQYAGWAMALLFFGKYYRRWLPYTTLSLAMRKGWRRFFEVNRDIFLRTLCLVAVTTFFTLASSQINDTVLAINTLLLQLFTLFSYMADGLAYAGEALTGKYIGARNATDLKRMIKKLFLWGGVLAAVFTLCYLLWGDLLLALLTNNAAILQDARHFFVWVLLIPLCGMPAFLWDGIYIGATASKAIRNTMFLATLLFFLLFFLTTSWGNHGLWFAFIVYLAARGVGLTLLARKQWQI